MKTIDRYIIRSFLFGYVILLLVGIGMYTLTDLMLNMDEFTEDRSRSGIQVLAMMIDFYGYNIPYYYSLLGGPVISIAAAFAFGRLLKNNELTALVAAGVPLQRLIAPVLICGIVLTGAWMANREFVIPRIADKVARSHDDVVGTKTFGVYCARDENNAILTALRAFTSEGLLERVYIFEPGQAGEPTTLIAADAARYVPQRKSWLLDRGRRLRMGSSVSDARVGHAITPEPVDEYPFKLSPQELILRRDSEWADLLSLRELNQLVRVRNLPNRAAIDMSRHIRLTEPLLQWLLVLLSAPFFLTREPTNVLVCGGKALVVGGLFFLAAFISHGIVRDESFAALIAWIPLMMFAPVAAILVSNMKT